MVIVIINPSKILQKILHIILEWHPIQIANRKVRNLQIGVGKLVGKVSINLLHLIKSAVCKMF